MNTNSNFELFVKSYHRILHNATSHTASNRITTPHHEFRILCMKLLKSEASHTASMSKNLRVRILYEDSKFTFFLRSTRLARLGKLCVVHIGRTYVRALFFCACELTDVNNVTDVFQRVVLSGFCKRVSRVKMCD